MSISYNEYLSLYQSYLEYLRSQTPIQAPMQAPIQAPMQTPIQAPMQAPIQAPMQTPIQAPMQTPIQAPMQTPIQAPMQTPIQAPIQTPMHVIGQPAIYRPPMVDNAESVLESRFEAHYDQQGGEKNAQICHI